MKDRSEDPSHHERTLLPRSYISLPLNSKMAAKTQHLQYLTRVLWVRYCVANQAGTKINPRWPYLQYFFNAQDYQICIFYEKIGSGTLTNDVTEHDWFSLRDP